MSIGNSSHDAPTPAASGSPVPEIPEGQDAAPSAPSIGHVLAQGRRDAGMSVDAVSAATRVRVPIVQGIEKDDFTRCGGDVYARGHIRSFARTVGLDPEPLVAQYDREHGGRPEPTTVAPLYEGERLRPEPRRPNWTAAMIAAIVVVVGFVGFTLLSGTGSSQPVAGHASQSRPAAPSRSTAPSPTATPSAQPSNSPIAAVPADEVVVKLTAGKGKSWVSATGADGNSLFQGLLQSGDSKTFTDDKKISLIIGNAGAIDMFVNGKDLGPAGADGQLVRTAFTPGDPQAG